MSEDPIQVTQEEHDRYVRVKSENCARLESKVNPTMVGSPHQDKEVANPIADVPPPANAQQAARVEP
eukprot:9867641-Prorocentrum_lima.AAC.1